MKMPGGAMLALGGAVHVTEPAVGGSQASTTCSTRLPGGHEGCSMAGLSVTSWVQSMAGTWLPVLVKGDDDGLCGNFCSGWCMTLAQKA